MKGCLLYTSRERPQDPARQGEGLAGTGARRDEKRSVESRHDIAPVSYTHLLPPLRNLNLGTVPKLRLEMYVGTGSFRTVSILTECADRTHAVSYTHLGRNIRYGKFD